jgi:hypothetical protein
MTERDREDDERLSTDDAIHPEIGTNIGAVPGEDDPVNISGYPGGSTGWGAWPEGEGTHDDAPESMEKIELVEAGEQIGARHGELADSGPTTGPVGS